MPISYAVSLVAQIIFKKEFSIKANNIFNWLKNYKLNKLKRELGLENNALYLLMEAKESYDKK
jgi:hypothetical protein